MDSTNNNNNNIKFSSSNRNNIHYSNGIIMEEKDEEEEEEEGLDTLQSLGGLQTLRMNNNSNYNNNSNSFRTSSTSMRSSTTSIDSTTAVRDPKRKQPGTKVQNINYDDDNDDMNNTNNDNDDNNNGYFVPGLKYTTGNTSSNRSSYYSKSSSNISLPPLNMNANSSSEGGTSMNYEYSLTSINDGVSLYTNATGKSVASRVTFRSLAETYDTESSLVDLNVSRDVPLSEDYNMNDPDYALYSNINNNTNVQQQNQHQPQDPSGVSINFSIEDNNESLSLATTSAAAAAAGTSSSSSSLSFSISATLPMALDNERFFTSVDGYYDLLKQASIKIDQLVIENEAWEEANNELYNTTFLTKLWRYIFKYMLHKTNDSINRLQLTRSLQDYLSYLSSYESFVLGSVIKAYDETNNNNNNIKDDDMTYSLQLAFRNRNVTRILRKHIILLNRWDWLWHIHTEIKYNRLFYIIGLIVRPFGLRKIFIPNDENNIILNDNDNTPVLDAFKCIIKIIFQFIMMIFCCSRKKNKKRNNNNNNNVVLNITPETTGMEEYNCKLYGVDLGRQITNQFRIEHRIGMDDEYIIRSFIINPQSTLINNGIEYVFICLYKHWRKMININNNSNNANGDYGNFTHHRLELLNPFEILRYHIPIVLQVLTNTRGRRLWDSQFLSSFIEKLQCLNPAKVRGGSVHVNNNIDNNDGGNNNNNNTPTAGIENDIEVLGPCQAGKKLIDEMIKNIIPNVCGGIPTREHLFKQWLITISDSFQLLQQEAEAVRDFISKVDLGIKMGYSVLKLVDWSVPDDEVRKVAIVNYILNKHNNDDDKIIHHQLQNDVIAKALRKLDQKDERTLKELIQQNLLHFPIYKSLLNRASTLLERELRREALGQRIRDLSLGRPVNSDNLEELRWYWVDSGSSGRPSLSMFIGRSARRLRFVDIGTNFPHLYRVDKITCREYIPLAESISRAQKAYMTIELDHCKRFSYNCFMEFGSSTRGKSLRTRLRRLVSLSQMQCTELDVARLNLLTEIQSSVKRSKTKHGFLSNNRRKNKPQNVVVLGGGPTGILFAIHSLQNVLLSGGAVKLYEGKNFFDQKPASYEQMQIVRLDARLVAMLRYHLGTSFEDVFVPAIGETDAFLGNNIPVEGFVEVSVKRLGSMLLEEARKLRSKNLLELYSDSFIEYHMDSDRFKTSGQALKRGDIVYDAVKKRKLKVIAFVFEDSLDPIELVQGNTYEILLQNEKRLHTFRLAAKDHQEDWYHFIASDEDPCAVNDSNFDSALPTEIQGSSKDLPPVYNRGIGRVPIKVIFEVNSKNREEVAFDNVANESYQLDLSDTHVVLALGKQAGLDPHFQITTEEPYAVCCIDGLKVCMAMHNFGALRWNSVIVDDWKSPALKNTRIVGDFRKSVAVSVIIAKMIDKLKGEADWIEKMKTLDETAYSILLNEVQALSAMVLQRRRLQIHFFELGNQCYLGMELNREFFDWKHSTVKMIIKEKPAAGSDIEKAETSFLSSCESLIDRLWFDATIEVIRTSIALENDNLGSTIPRLYILDSPREQSLGTLEFTDTFRISRQKLNVHAHNDTDAHNDTGVSRISSDQESVSIPTRSNVLDAQTGKKIVDINGTDVFQALDHYEIIFKTKDWSFVRSSGGFVARLSNSTRVCRLSDLARETEGFVESKGALASFLLSNYVSHRTIRGNKSIGRGGDETFFTVSVGDAQASPHFMRYSELTSACINCMSFNNLIGNSLSGLMREDLMQRYSFETCWCNEEVLHGGVGSHFGEDAFLRPGFSYDFLLDFLYDRALEMIEIGSTALPIPNYEWKVLIASAIVPRGLETDNLFFESLLTELGVALRTKFESVVSNTMGCEELPEYVEAAILNEIHNLTSPPQLLSVPNPSDPNLKIVHDTGLILRRVVEALWSALHLAVELRLKDERVSSAFSKQPRPMDTISNEYGLMFRLVLGKFSLLIAVAVASVSLYYVSTKIAIVASEFLALWCIFLSVRVMVETNVTYQRDDRKIRCFSEEKMLSIEKGFSSSIAFGTARDKNSDRHPLLFHVDRMIDEFLVNAEYFNLETSTINEFKIAYEIFKKSSSNHNGSIAFMRKLVQEFIPKTFHHNSYLQENLVDIYKALDDTLATIRLQQPQEQELVKSTGERLAKLREALVPNIAFEKKEGRVYASKRRSVFCHNPIRQRSLLRGIRHILTDAHTFGYGSGKGRWIAYGFRDLKEFLHTWKQRDATWLLFWATFCIFFFALMFLVLRVIAVVGPNEDGLPVDEWLEIALDVCPWILLLSLPGISFVVMRRIKEMEQIRQVSIALADCTDKQVHPIRSLARLEFLKTLVLVVSMLATLVALFLKLVAITWPSQFKFSDYIALYVSCGSILAEVFATFISLGARIWVAYNTDPNIAKSLSENLRPAMNDIRRLFPEPNGTEIDTTQKLERRARDYAAREFLDKYRFDLVLPADILSSVYYFLQLNAFYRS